MIITNYNLCYSTNRCFPHSTIRMFTFHYKEFTIIVKEVKVWIKSKLENLLPSVEKKKI